MGEGAEAEKGASAMYYQARNQKVCIPHNFITGFYWPAKLRVGRKSLFFAPGVPSHGQEVLPRGGELTMTCEFGREAK